MYVIGISSGQTYRYLAGKNSITVDLLGLRKIVILIFLGPRRTQSFSAGVKEESIGFSLGGLSKYLEKRHSNLSH